MMANEQGNTALERLSDAACISLNRCDDGVPMMGNDEGVAALVWLDQEDVDWCHFWLSRDLAASQRHSQEFCGLTMPSHGWSLSVHS